MSEPEEELDFFEQVARFITVRQHVRSDNTIRPDALIPYRYVDLSVTRHFEISQQRIWELGRQVVAERGGSLEGRADLHVVACRSQGLRVMSTPQPENASHADVVDWPEIKADQKELAIEIAKCVDFQRTPLFPPAIPLSRDEARGVKNHDNHLA